MEQAAEMGDFFVVDYDINVQAPKDWNKSQIKFYAKKLNNSLTPEQKAVYRKKNIPFDERYAVPDYIMPGEIASVPKLEQSIIKRINHENYKRKGKNTNWFSTLYKSGWNQTVDIATGAYNFIRETPEAIGAGAAWLEYADDLTPKSREKWKKDLATETINRIKKRGNVANEYKFPLNPYESESAQSMGSLAPTLFATGIAGLSVLLRGGSLSAALRANLPVAEFFGLSSANEMYTQVLENGGSIVDAYLRANAAGISEAALEQFGLMSFNRFYKRKHFPFLLLAAGSSEGLQEGAQSTKDIFVGGKYDVRTADQKLDDIFDSAWYGAIGGITFGLGGAVGANRFLSMREKVYNAAIEAGKDPETALKLAQGAVPTEGKVTEDAAEFLNEMFDIVPQYTSEQLEEMEQSLNLARDLDNEDAIAEVEFYENIRKALRPANVSDNEKRRVALTTSLTLRMRYEALKEMGTHTGGLAALIEKYYPQFSVRDKKDTRAVKIGDRVVEIPAAMTEEEINKAWQERNAERQMTAEEREFFEERPSRKLFSLGDGKVDFAEFRGNPEGAIEKLLQEKSGYVSGAIYKEGIGDIDFIYGEPGKNGYGLAHIIERRNQQGINGEEFVREIPEIIRTGSVYNVLGQSGRKFILSNDKEALIRLDWDGEQRNWLLTAYMKENGALPVGLTSGQTYLDEQTPSSNSISINNISSDTENVNNKLFSTGETVQGTYDPSERLIELFADAKPDTLMHEVSHYFFQGYFRMAEDYGFSKYDRGVMDWLSRKGKHKIKGFADMQDQDWENLTEAFIRYLNTGVAPTIATTGLFQKAKEWALDLFEINRDYASDEVKDFFDNLISREGKMPNLDAIEQNMGDLKEALRRALNGESATVRNINRKKLRDLRTGINRRIRRQGRTLAQELRSMGYRVDALNGKLLDGNGIVEDNVLAEIFKDLGVIENLDTETYEQTDALSTQMQNILQGAENTYSPRERAIQAEHDEGVQAQLRLQEIVNDLLQDNQLGIKSIEELDELLARIESKPDDADIVKVNRDAIKYLQAKTAEIKKNYNEAIRQTRQEEKVRRETQYQLQNRMKNFIRSLPVTGDHKASLMGNIQRVKDAESFEAVLNDVRRRAAGYIEQEQKQLNRRNIEETIKSTKPTKFRKQRYTYEDNKFFAELRDILKMSRAEALRAQEAFAGQIGLARADGEVPLGINISEYDRLKNLLYYYKINGAESSLAALQDLATSLEELKAAAADKRLDEDTLKSEVRKKDKDELLEGINKYKASNIFARGMAKIGTIRSAMSEYFGKEMADKWNLEPAFERVNIFMRSRIKPVMDSARKIYGAAKASDFLNLMQNKSQKEFELTDNDGDYDKLSIMDIADIYIGMKDPNTRANYYAAYEKFDDTMPTDRGQLRAAIETMSDEQLREHMLTNNLGTLLSYLSEQDMRFADMVQEEVGSMWELENEIFVKLYGIDLPQNRNYFPRTSKNAQDYDVMENLRVRGQTPGFFKERASTVTPRPKNIWTKYQEYVTSVGYVQNVALKYKDLHSLMTDKAIRGAIVKKYGEDSYRAFMANLDDLSIKGAVKTYNEVGRTMQKLLNNLVSGTVALNVPMAFKQLPAALNYSVNMPKTEFIKNFLYAATHPAEVKRVMDSYVGDFLKTRYEQGSQSDAIGRAMAEADSLVNSKFGLAGFSHNWRQLATTPIRFADIFAIYWGGYAKLKYNIDRGLAPEKIREDFIDETLSNQAAGNPATLAKFQREQSLRFFTAFRNVPAQYMRLITTTMTQWRRGEISDARFFSNIGNYVFVQPALYIWLGWLVKSFLYGDDDDEWFDGMMTEMALSPIAGLPIIADLASFGLDKAESALTGKSPEPWDALQVFGVDTLNKLMWKLVKDDKTGWDWAEIAASVIDVGTGAGLGTAVRTVKKLSD